VKEGRSKEREEEKEGGRKERETKVRCAER
jgi:hypothetical protein